MKGSFLQLNDARRADGSSRLIFVIANFLTAHFPTLGSGSGVLGFGLACGLWVCLGACVSVRVCLGALVGFVCAFFFSLFIGRTSLLFPWSSHARHTQFLNYLK